MRIPINSDGHGVETFQYVEIGAAQARRAWMTPDQVLNTRPWPHPNARTVTFREDGHAAVEWVADYLERIDQLPVMAQVGRAS